MKFGFILFTHLISVSVFACPQIAGTYSCNLDGEIETLVVNQGIQNGVPYYDFDGDVIVMDGQFSFYDGVDLAGTIMAQCSSRAIAVLKNEDLLDQGQKVGEIKTSTRITASGNNIVLFTYGTRNDHGIYTAINETKTCTRQ